MRKIFLTSLILITIVFGGLIMNNQSQVAMADCPEGQICPPTSSSTFGELLNTITNFLFLISIPIVSIMILWGGFQMLTAAGTPDKIEKGKKTILYAVIGFIVIIISKGAALIIKDILGV